jgi:hypothetical protein
MKSHFEAYEFKIPSGISVLSPSIAPWLPQTQLRPDLFILFTYSPAYCRVVQAWSRGTLCKNDVYVKLCCKINTQETKNNN